MKEWHPIALLALGVVVGIFIGVVLLHAPTSSDCRRDALDAMCRTYADTNGGAKEVVPQHDYHAYYVVCELPHMQMRINMTGLE
jgi:hypothetical protein